MSINDDETANFSYIDGKVSPEFVPDTITSQYTLETFRWTLRINNDIVNLESDVWYNPAILHKLNGNGYPEH